MSNVGPLASYKLKSFFSPSYKGKYGPLPLIALSLIFIPSGISTGFYMGEAFADSDPEFALNLLGTALSAMMVFGFLFSLGVGITAQPSELDFLMTAQVRPREYLIADLVFQLLSIIIAGGMAILLALFGFLWGMGEPLVTAVPLLLLLGLYGMMVFLIVQVLTVLKIRYTRFRVRTAILVLLVLSVLPMASLATADFPVGFGDLPIPQSAFAAIAYGVLSGSAVDAWDVVIAAAYVLALLGLWAKVSTLYFFHGVRPTLSAGFGQVDMSSKMAQQKKMIAGFGRFTTKTALRTDSGGELSLMTRLNLIRFWRDGSFLFAVLFIALFLAFGVMQSGAEDGPPVNINLFMAGAWPVIILALNWCYYERENLWIPVVSGQSLVSYFQGMMMALVVVGVGVAAALLGLLAAVGVSFGVEELAIIISTPIADAGIATMLLTRVRVKPGAFSPGLLAILFGTLLIGSVISGAMLLAVAAIGDSTALLAATQLAVMAGLSIGLCLIGLSAVTRLARGFRFG